MIRIGVASAMILCAGAVFGQATKQEISYGAAVASPKMPRAMSANFLAQGGPTSEANNKLYFRSQSRKDSETFLIGMLTSKKPSQARIHNALLGMTDAIFWDEKYQPVLVMTPARRRALTQMLAAYKSESAPQELLKTTLLLYLENKKLKRPEVLARLKTSKCAWAADWSSNVEDVQFDLRFADKAKAGWKHPQALTSADPVPMGGPPIWPQRLGSTKPFKL